jgi:hypothetical protein
MLVDFVGPGLRVNPNLFKFWSQSIIPILVISGILLTTFIILSWKFLIKGFRLMIFTLAWFLIAISPVLFLPFHKFVYYLTLPLIGVVIYISSLLVSFKKNYLILLFGTLWIMGSYLTLRLTNETHWVSRGGKTAQRVDKYFRENKDLFVKFSKIAFIDTEKDSNLPWKPSEVVKSSLSDENYFKVFYPGRFEVYYGNEDLSEDVIKIEARQFIGY